MKKLLLSLALLMGLTGAASAEVVKISVADAISAMDGLASIDAGYERIKDGANERVVTAHHELLANVKAGMAKDIARLRAALTPVMDEYNAVRASLCPDGVERCQGENRKKSDAEFAAVMRRELSLDLILFTDADFEKYAIRPLILSRLGPLLPGLK